MMKRSGFTLIEVTLAMGIMAAGALVLVGLYSFGYRENQQSAEDVQAAAIAELHLNAMVAALSSTNMSWTVWRGLGMQPASGWGEYAGDGTGSGTTENDGSSAVRPNTNPNKAAGEVFNSVMSAAGFSSSFDANGLCVGIVLTPSDDYRTYSVAVRCGRRAAMLVYQPLYYSEVSFQGFNPDGGKK